MKISIVVPVYNEEAYLENCLESLVNQMEPADEIIIVDNNSTDNSVKIARRYPVRVLKEKKQGMIHARNRAFNAAKYGLMARTDADAIVSPDWIKKIKKNFERYKIDALYGPVTFYDLPLKTPAYTKMHFDILRKIQKGKEANLFGPNMVVTKDIWNAVKGELCSDESKVHEDHDLGLHIARIGGKIRRDNKLVVQTSARRMLRNPKSFFLEYPARMVKTLAQHDF